MNEQQTKLIEKLAEKLGTTVEHLWSVLIKQAPIDAISGCVGTAVILFAGVVIYNKVKNLPVDDYGDVQAGGKDTGIPRGVLKGLAIAILLTGLICASFDINAVATALFNPEFFAFKQIVK